jgi:hypothetical protein
VLTNPDFLFGPQESDNDRPFEDEMHARIDQLKQRRNNDRTNMILSAAARGDLASMKLALKVYAD